MYRLRIDDPAQVVPNCTSLGELVLYNSFAIKHLNSCPVFNIALGHLELQYLKEYIPPRHRPSKDIDHMLVTLEPTQISHSANYSDCWKIQVTKGKHLRRIPAKCT